jgi:hypothetical protein
MTDPRGWQAAEDVLQLAWAERLGGSEGQARKVTSERRDPRPLPLPELLLFLVGVLVLTLRTVVPALFQDDGGIQVDRGR